MDYFKHPKVLILIMIKNISVRGGQLADTCGFICSPFFGKSNSGNGIYIMDCSSTGLISGINSGGIVGGAFGMGHLFINHQ